MTTAEKLRFLADRVEDRQKFTAGLATYVFQGGYDSELMICQHDSREITPWTPTHKSFNEILAQDLKLGAQWVFTEDEKTILKSMNPTWNYIARDRYNALYAYHSKPVKTANSFIAQDSSHWLQAWKHLFQTVQWSDEEACPFREYL